MERHREPAEPALLPDHERWMVDALLALFEANRRDGEAYAQCFQRVGAPRYAAYLADVLTAQRTPQPIVDADGARTP